MEAVAALLIRFLGLEDLRRRWEREEEQKKRNEAALAAAQREENQEVDANHSSDSDEQPF